MVDQSMAGAIMWFAGDGLMMMLMIVIGGRWIVDGDRVGAGLGPWLDRVRRQATLGSDADDSIDLDYDEAALAAYNARLAGLNRRRLDEPRR